MKKEEVGSLMRLCLDCGALTCAAALLLLLWCWQ